MKSIFPLLLAIVLLAGGFVWVSQNKESSASPALEENDASQAANGVALEGEAPSGKAAAAEDEPTFASAPRVPWPHETGDIPATERATFGALENGMRYVILPNAEPPKRVSLRLHIDAGSLHEADDQRGVAHFLEHMVFNGSRNFPDPKELIPQMERLGIAFGAHANAYTSFDETVYMLDLPNLAEPTLQLAFTVMQDFADGALLRGEEIDKERGVILSEKNSRDSVQTRLMEQQFQLLMPDSLITHRFPIGIEEVIKSAVRERFVSFYDDYYVPSKMTFVVAGDIEVASMESRIREAFGGLKNPDKQGSEPDLGTIPSGQGFRVAVFSDPEVSSDDLSLLQLNKAEVQSDSVAVRQERQPLAMAHAMLNRRFSILAKTENSPIQSGSAARGVWFQSLEFGSLDVTATKGRWQEAVAVMEQEFRRALEYGFTQAEFEEIKANLLNAYQQAVEREATQQSASLAMEVVSSINDLKALSSPQEDLRIFELGLESLSPQTCHEAFRAFWQTSDLTLVLTTSKATDETEGELARLYEESQAIAVQAPEEEEVGTFAYTDFGPAGSIVSENRIEDLDITQVVLSNEVRVNWKRTEFAKNSVSFVARFGGGQATMPRDRPGLDQVASAVLNAGGLGQHSEDALQRLLAGRNVGVAFGIEETAFTLSGRATPKDLELQLQLMCAYLTDPGYREEALRQYRKALPDFYKQLAHDLSGAQAEMSQWLHGEDPRYVIPPLETALAYSIEEVKSWVEEEMKSPYLELSLVGDFDPAALRSILLKTVGALPARAAGPADLAEALTISFPETPQQKEFTYQSQIPKAAAMLLWKTKGVGEDIATARRTNILADILGNRMREKIREELGATYSPQAASQPSDGFPDFGYLFGISIAKPEDLAMINQITLELGAALAREGADADELERALNPVLSQLKEIERNNNYWLGTVMARSQAEPYRIEWARERNADYESITLEEINKLAAEYLTPERAIQVELKPE